MVWNRFVAAEEKNLRVRIDGAEQGYDSGDAGQNSLRERDRLPNRFGAGIGSLENIVRADGEDNRVGGVEIRANGVILQTTFDVVGGRAGHSVVLHLDGWDTALAQLFVEIAWNSLSRFVAASVSQ